MILKHALKTFPALIIVAMAMAAGPASAAVTCGDVITKDVKLHSDLDCRGMDTLGLEIGAKGVTVDLKGHSVLGTGTYGKPAIRNDHYRDMTVKNGSIIGFDGGVLVGEALAPKVQNLKVTGDGATRYGVSLSYTRYAKVTHVAAKHVGDGFELQHGDRNTLSNLKTDDAGDAVYLFDETNARISDSKLGTNQDGEGVSDTAGAGNRYRNVTVKDSQAYYGFLLTQPQNVTIDRSVANNTSTVGVYVFGNDPANGYSAKVTRTSAINNSGYGMYADFKVKSGGNTAKANGLEDCVKIKCDRGINRKATRAATVSCGDTVTEDVKLTSDLNCAAMDLNGLNVGANNVTIDLNGHFINGTAAFGKAGIRNDTYRNLTVKNGAIRGFDSQILLNGGAQPRIENVKVTGSPQSRYGISLSYTESAEVVSSKTRNVPTGIVAQHGNRTVIHDADLDNVIEGLYLSDETNARVSDVTEEIVANGTGVSDTAGAGNHYTNVRIEGGDSFYGIYANSPRHLQIDRSVTNDASNSGVLIEANDPAQGYSASITRTTANHNGVYGMFASYRVKKSSANKARGNGTDCVRVKCDHGGVLKASALTTAPACGDVITTDLKLKADLDCSASNSNGLEVGAGGVTVDLNGHTITGNGTDSYIGIQSNGLNDVSITDGTVRSFGTQVSVGGGKRLLLKGVDAEGPGSTGYGIVLTSTHRAKVSDVDVSHAGVGMFVAQRGPTSVSDATITDTGIGLSVSKKRNSSFTGIDVSGSDSTGVEDYEGRNVSYDDVSVRDGGDIGLKIYRPMGVSVTGSHVTGMDATGVLISDNAKADGYAASVTGTTANRNGQFGMFAESPGTKSSGNKAKGNPVACVNVKCNEGR